MLSRNIPQPRADEREHLIVELKRPKKVIDSGAYDQIESYAMAVAADERFRDTKTRWIFWAVSDDIVRARQPNKPEGLYRLYDLPRPERNKPWKFKHLTVDQVYRPLARSNGKILQLTREQRESSKARWRRLHQFLSEIGVKALRRHLGQLLGIARISKTQEQYEKHFQLLFSTTVLQNGVTEVSPLQSRVPSLLRFVTYGASQGEPEFGRSVGSAKAASA